jgi:SAM-dependent methyltransferase
MQRLDSGGTYVLPSGPREIDRLDVQHHIFRLVVGDHYLAPIERPGRILDVGCGTGQWCFELCERFPDAEVVGLDPRPGKETALPNYRYVEGDVVEGLPFDDGTFDFVHQRLLIAGIPMVHWTRAVAELVRVTAPGGWVELVEWYPYLNPEGDAANRLMGLMRSRFRARGMDSSGHLFRELDRYLRDGGLVGVNTHTALAPVGNWADAVGKLGLTNLRSFFAQLSPLLAHHHITIEAQHALLQEMLDACEVDQPHMKNRLAWGQRRVSQLAQRVISCRDAG